MYLIAKHAHLTLILISVCFLIIRVIARANNAQWLQKKWVKISPHVIDTLLLSSAIVLMVSIAQYPIENHWLSVKIVALFSYIGLGTLALKGNKSAGLRVGYLLMALSCIGFMVSVAITKNPMPWG